jgi:hypothetical protein
VWGIVSVVGMLLPLLWLTLDGSWRVLRGPQRRETIGWMLVAATPLVWAGAYLANLHIGAHGKTSHAPSATMKVALVWVSSILDIEAYRNPITTDVRHTWCTSYSDSRGR